MEAGINKNKLFIVYGDTYEGTWGTDYVLFGVFDSLEIAKQAREKREKEYTDIYKKPFKFEIEEINKNENVCIGMGQYYE